MLPEENFEQIYYRFVVGLETDCNFLIQELTQKGIGCARPIFLPIHRRLKINGYPVTDKVWETALSLPIYPSLRAKEAQQIITNFINMLKTEKGRQ